MTAAEKIVAVYKKNGVETGELDSGIPILLDDYLANLASPTAASPATVRLNSSVRLADDWGLVDQMARNAAKHIILDLSACPDTSISGRDAQGSPAPSGNDFNIIRNNQYIKGIILPTSLTVIGDYAFDGCDNITRIGNEADKLHIPVGVTQVGTMAFQGVNHIATLVFDSRNGTALSIGISAFAGTGSDTNGPSTSVTTGFSGALVIPANTTFEKNASNASRAFEFRKFFTSLVIEEGCTDIPQMAFQWCQGITEITIPASVTTIRTNAFKRCEGVTKVSILAAPADRGIQKITTFESQSSGTAVNRVRTLYNNGDSGAGHYAGVYTGDTAAVVWSPLP
jgi:hypothetical protein